MGIFTQLTQEVLEARRLFGERFPRQLDNGYLSVQRLTQSGFAGGCVPANSEVVANDVDGVSHES